MGGTTTDVGKLSYENKKIENIWQIKKNAIAIIQA